MPHSQDRGLRRKLTLRAHGRTLVMVKRPRESMEHVLTKACLWALYLPQYPELQVERSIGDRFKPDVVALDGNDRPVFWGEAGEVGRHKIRSLARRFPDAHLVLAKWTSKLEPHRVIVERALRGVRRRGLIELLGIDPEVSRDAIADDGAIGVRFQDIERIDLGA